MPSRLVILGLLLVRHYQQVRQTCRPDAGIDFYDKVLLPFGVYLEEGKQIPEALACVERARQTLRVEKGGQLEKELAELVSRLKSDQK